MKRSGLIAALAAAALSACATGTPYQSASGSDRGYSEMKIEDNRYHVEFSGNTLTDRKTVETYLLYRAAEVTRQNGFDHFRVVRRQTDADTRLVSDPASYSPFHDHFFLSYRYFGPRAYYFYNRHRPLRYGFHDPFWDGPVEFRERTRYVASAEIVMGQGEKPDDVAFFDADQVIFNLAGEIRRPE